jgi:hypothetical protein
VWGIGLTAHRLLWAGKGEQALQRLENEISYQVSTWEQKFSDEAVKGNPDLGDFVDVDFADHDNIYSIGLIRFVQRCLKFNPEERHTPFEMKLRIDGTVARLDGLYGDEIKKPRDTIAAGHKVLVEDKKWQSFDIGQQYEPPRKRRRVSISQGISRNYNALVERWSDVSRYPRPNLGQQAQVVFAIDKHIADPEDSDILEDARLRHCWHYLRACILHRVDPNSSTHVVTQWKGKMVTSFELPAKRDILVRLEKMVIPTLLSDDSLGALHDAIRVLEHVVEWSAILVDANGNIGTPFLEKKTELHRGFRDWIFIHPYDVDRND